MKKTTNNQSNNISDNQQFDLIKSISDRLSSVQQNMHKLTKEYKQIQKQIKNQSNQQQIKGLKQEIINELRLEIERLNNNPSNRLQKGKSKSDILQDTGDLMERLGVKKIKQDILMLKQDATETYKIASKAFKQTTSNEQSETNIEKHCKILVENSMNQVMKIIKNYIEDQSIIKIEIQALKDQVYSISAPKVSPKANKSKRPASVSKTSDKKSNNAKWDGTASQRKQQPTHQRQRIMTTTQGNKSGKSFQKISDLKQKLKQFQMINDKYKVSKKQKAIEKSDRKSQISKTSKKQGPQAIDQLKKFKHILQNTESQIDISNTLNQEGNSLPTDYSKFHQLSKLYSGVNK